MQSRFNQPGVFKTITLLMVMALLMSIDVYADTPGETSGLNDAAAQELIDAGVDKYLGEFIPVSSNDVGDGWTEHKFDADHMPDDGYPLGRRPDGPVCIAGTDYSVYTRQGDPKKLLVFLQGGGACWQGLYACNILAEDQAPGEDSEFIGKFGVFDASQPDNPFADYSVVYMPYCDGSTFGGDNDVFDGDFIGGVRHHRGLRNASAGMDVAGELFPRAKQITVMGHSAGGVGVASFTPFLARFVFGNDTKLTVYNDAGPIAVNLGTPPGPNGPDRSWLSVFARQNDWQFQQFYPQSCIDDGRCNAFGQQTGIIDWRLDNDSTIREGFYETDADATNRFFAQGDGVSRMDPEDYRELILTEHGALNAAHPKRYKRFIVTADDTHGGVQGTAQSPCSGGDQPFLFYTQQANQTLLTEWAREFVSINNRQSNKGWKDIVEDYAEVPCTP